jgi:hypothetical protein
MNQKIAIAIQFAVLPTLVACAASIPISGETRADDTLKSDVIRKISVWAKSDVKCDRVDSIKTQIIQINPIGTGDTPGARKYGSTDERWIVNLCGKSLPFGITFVPDGKGGTYFYTKRKPGEVL